MRQRLTILAALAALLALVAGPVHANPSNGPWEAGAVTRFAEPGAQGLFDATARLGHEVRPLVAFFNVDSTAMFCGMGVDGAGDLQLVRTKSGHRHFLLHDEVPVLVFDATGLGSSAAEVFPQLSGAVCDDGLEPIARGRAEVRNKVHFDEANGTFRHVFDAVGDVTDGETTWNLSTHRRASGALPLTGPPEVHDQVRLAQTGR